MSDLRHRTVLSDRGGAEHERARALAAAGLVSSLSPADAAALASHLDTCRECRQASLDYAFQGERIHALPSIELPRDAWPAFAARLDAEEARVAGERARKAGRSRVASQAHPLGGRPDRVPGTLTLAAAPAARGHRTTPVVASVGLGSMLALVATIALVASGLPQLLVGPSATPFAVDPSSVAWVQRDADGRFLLQAAPVNSACPSSSTSCVDFGSRPSTIVALDMEPASVFLARGGRDAIVVDVGAAGAGTMGGSIYAIQLPTPYPTFAGAGAPTGEPAAAGAAILATAAATATAATVATAAAVPSASARATTAPGTASPLVVAGALASLRPTSAPVASFVNAGGPGASLPAAVPLPTAAITRAIAEDVVLVGGRAAYSPDGKWFAFSARPADASVGPDVYVWRVGDDRSRAITSDHAAVFAGWVGDMLLVSSPDAAAVRAAAAATDEAAAKAENAGKGAATAKPAPTPTPRATAKPKSAGAGADATAKPKKTPAGDASAEPDGSATPAAETTSPTPSPTPGPATVPVSYLLDPATGESTAIEQPGLWLPSVDPTGTRIVGWLGTVRPDPATRSWRPAGGSLVVGSWATVLGDEATALAPADATGPEAKASATPTAADATPEPKKSAAPATTPDPADGAVPASDAEGDAATPEPTLDPADPDGAEASATPSTTSDPDASDGPASAPGTGAPESLGVPSLVGRLPATWQVRWDPSGTHLAIWVQSSLNPEVGSLTLVAFDPDGVAAPKALLSATPAKPGFAIGKTRIAWATPSVTSAGGRVRVLVWSGPAVGETGTAPISGLETLVEAD